MFVEQQKGQKINETRPVAVTVTWFETERIGLKGNVLAWRQCGSTEN